MNTLLMGVILAGSLLGTSALSTPSRCSGGGGVPFSSIPNTGYIDWRPLATQQSIEELTVLERENGVLLRMANGEVELLHPKQQTQQRLLGSVFSPLSRIMDPLGVYFTNASASAPLWSYDRKHQTAGFVQFPKPEIRPQPLFWNRHFLFSAVQEGEIDGTIAFGVYQSNMRVRQSELTCTWKLPPGSGAPHIARGSEYPHLYVGIAYPSSTKGKDTLKIYSLHVETCASGVVAKEGPELEGPVKSLYYFPSADGFATILSHYDRGFVWWDGQGCQYLNTDGNTMIVPNAALPMMVGWNEQEGISLFNIVDRTRKPVGLGLRPYHLSESRSWITGDKLYIAPDLAEHQTRPLIEVTLNQK
ncbi:MAG: hypothetical protein HYR96_02390 [Deltaproteobacteria bacterium]|nr:hypothetical protein [Deltaproteobacteria bacterium]MBI3293157.1 hypothetical protein [Deltaproteobacteria bacterium]